MKTRKKFSWPTFFVYAFLCLYLLYTLYPIFLMIMTSLKPNQEILRNPIGLPVNWTAGGYQKIFTTQNFLLYFQNSLFVTLMTLAITLVVSLMLAYALSRYNYRSARFLYFFFLAGMMIPIRLGMLFLNDLLNFFGLIDNLWGLMLIYIAMSIPFSMFILTGFIKMIPTAMDESAYMDGANELVILLRIIVPLVKPAIATVLVYNFVPIWNDVYFPLIFLRAQQNKTLMLAVTIFFGQFQTDWNLVFSALATACVPVLMVYLLGSKYLIKGLMAGALKG